MYYYSQVQLCKGILEAKVHSNCRTSQHKKLKKVWGLVTSAGLRALQDVCRGTVARTVSQCVGHDKETTSNAIA